MYIKSDGVGTHYNCPVVYKYRSSGPDKSGLTDTYTHACVHNNLIG